MNKELLCYQYDYSGTQSTEQSFILSINHSAEDFRMLSEAEYQLSQCLEDLSEEGQIEVLTALQEGYKVSFITNTFWNEEEREIESEYLIIDLAKDIIVFSDNSHYKNNVIVKSVSY